ncbi:response regulator [Hoyosella altamirensis]|uniref:DNA-binding NarL/FixJ family response regulator n=1 Tax=Hoyosella altamirensis TaxID=616997 RepID=A0A839RND4_9ACTN|nr:response regulator transcription factor [Hoyosella altamirensis]MBB3037897.1 DNA-binding NarL/FixJ family response regulator [Hoyosella altamirensis]
MTDPDSAAVIAGAGDPASTPIRVLLADDYEPLRTALRFVLDAADDILIVGEAADGHSAVTNARALRPDVVLMDVQMPRVDGIDATREIVREELAEVLVLTTFDLDEYVFGALRAGAAGFLLKTAEPGDILSAVRRVAAGDGVVAPEVTRRVLATFVSPPDPSGEPDPAVSALDRLTDLTPRERDVLVALSQGQSNQQIADGLFITEATAKTHVSRILAKLGCASRVQAAILARQAGLV